MKSILRYWFCLTGILAITMINYGCVETMPIKDTDREDLNIASCMGCHTSYATLKKLADPVTDPPVEGCGGAAPFIEPFDRVFLGGPGFERFKNSEHGQIGCTSCHGGVDNTADKNKAHSGNFVKSPSSVAHDTCGECHYDIVENVEGSLHQQGWGQKNAVALRLGYDSYHDLPENIHEGYEQNCSICHSSCGSCHVTRPLAGGGGLYRGHDFQRTPDMRDNCIACHTSRAGHAYFGLGIGTNPDLHLTRAGFNCMDCHDQKNVHGDGNTYSNRFESPLNPSCVDCHSDQENSNSYHEAHLGDFNCHVCHSQDYNNCGSCHVGGEGARIPSHLDFKIGINPIPEKKPYRMALLRRTPAAPDNWAEYGIEKAENFDGKTTFNYTTPHNIQKWTSRTQVDSGNSCYANCHVRPDEPVNNNRELYLFEKDLEKEWEKSANRDIVVDGRLPKGWE